MTNPVQGLHHLTVMAGDPQRNVDFYTALLGQRLVKVTVNFDDPGTYHLYYGDDIGTPGTILTFFPWPHAQPGRKGNGEATAVAYAIPADSVTAWKTRLSEQGVAHTEQRRFAQTVLTFHDPDGLQVELITDDTTHTPRPWPRSPVAPELAPQGIHSTTLWVAVARPVHALLTEHFGFRHAGVEPDAQGTRHRYKAAGTGVGTLLDVVERPSGTPGKFGVGSVHHIALRARDGAEQAAHHTRLRQAGYTVTSVQDRQYFQSIYFRDPTGVLFEIATDAPGFSVDEPRDELGSALKLPARYEAARDDIEARVPPLVNPEYGVTIGGPRTAAAPKEARA